MSASASPTRAAFVDLHTHSTASDGVLPPEKVIEAAQRCGLVAIALTDHDTINGIPAARSTGESLGVRVIAGVELSAFLDDHEVHVLALHVSQLDALEKRPKILPGADGEDTIAIRTCAYFSISFDHRIIDGAIADQFLAFLKKTIETFPETGL